MTTQFANLNWPQRLQIVSSLNVSNEQAASVMGVTVDELEQAKQQYIADATFQAEPFASHFATAKTSTETTVVAKAKNKRGRKTTKIQDAFKAITTTKQPLAEFCITHKVSVHCMRQHQRFAPDRPDIVVRKDKESGQVMIWSDPSIVSTDEK